MTTAALLALLVAAAPSTTAPAAELCVIEQPVSYIMTTDPAKTAASYCRRPSDAERAAAGDVDGRLLRGGTYHLFILANRGPMRIEWTGQATGTQIFVSVWNGRAFEISDLRGPAATRVTHTLDVRRPATEERVYVLVNGTNGRIATDGLRVLPWSPDVARVDTQQTARAPAAQRARSSPGRSPLYLATCTGDSKVVLIASSSTQGITAAADHDLGQLAEELSAATWYPVPAEGEWRILGERFETPAVTAEDGLRLLELGRCETPGMVYSTAPTTEFESPTTYSEQTVRSMHRSARSTVGRTVGRTLAAVDAAPAPDRHVGLRLCGSEEGQCFGWMLLDAKRRLRRVTARSDAKSWLSLAEPQTHVEAARWLRPRLGSPYWVAVLRWDASESECDGESCGSLSQQGLWLIWIRGARVQTVRVVVRELKA